MADKLAGIKREKLKQKLMDAYESYQRGEKDGLDILLTRVREFVYSKVYHLEHEFRDTGSAETADDWAQDVLLDVWQALPSFNDTPEAFYSWVHKAAFNKASKSFNHLQEHKDTFVKLSIASEDEEGGEEEVDNPAIYSNQENPVQFSLPPDLTKDDRKIIYAILRGKEVQNGNKNHPYLDVGDWMTQARTDQEIADELGLNVNTYRTRVETLRNKVKAWYNQ